MLILTNDFHGTETRVRITEEELEDISNLADSCGNYKISLHDGRIMDCDSARKYRRSVKLKLCCAGCTCSDAWGVR